MLVGGMEHETYTRGDPDDAGHQDSGRSSPLLSRVRSGTERARLDGATLHPASLQSFSTKTSPPSSTKTPSTVVNQGWTFETPRPWEPSSERPSKRIRLETQHERMQPLRYTRRKESISESTPSQSHSDLPNRRPSLQEDEEDASHRHQDTHDYCSNCCNTDELMALIVTELSELQSDIRQSFSASRLDRSHFGALSIDVTQQNLEHSLALTLQEIRNTSRWLRSTDLATKPGLPSLADVVPHYPPAQDHSRRPSLSGQSPPLATTINDSRHFSRFPEPHRVEDYFRRNLDIRQDNPHHPDDKTLAPIVASEEMKRAQAHDQMTAPTTHSPHPSSGSSVFGSVPSPMQSHPVSRTLPSPPNSQYPQSATTATSQYSPTLTHAAQTTHLHDLQHQISTKSLALQTLQREHDQLLAAFSRSQIRCNTLDKKSQVSDHEINSLTEEKQRLQQQVEALEAQVEELIKARDDAQRQCSADGAQWRQIMAMSSQLQMKGADEARQFKAEREAWERDRENLCRRIQQLEAEGGVLSPATSRSSGAPASVADNDVLASNSLDVLKQEIVRLRRKCSDMGLMLQEITGATEKIDHAVKAIANVREKMAGVRRPLEES